MEKSREPRFEPGLAERGACTLSLCYADPPHRQVKFMTIEFEALCFNLLLPHRL